MSAAIRILVADDEPILRELTTEALVLMGVECVAVSDGSEAITALRGGTFHLILMDCQMPGPDGFLTSAAIRADLTSPNHSIPIVAMSASGRNTTFESRCRLAGMNDCLMKPFSLSELGSILKKWLKLDEEPSSHLRNPEAEVTLDMSQIDAFGANVDYRRLIEKFCLNLPVVIARIKKDPRIIPEECHRLKSSSLALGAKRLSLLSARLEENPGDLVLEELEEESKRVARALRRHY